MDAERTAAALRDQNGALADLCRAADPDTAVPACPGWTMRQLLTHVGRGDRWAATIVAETRHVPLEMRAVPDGRAPTAWADAIAWLRGGAEQLIAATAGAGETTVWTFTGPQPSSWWRRRRLHEALMHRIDAAEAVGAGYDIAPALAGDAVDELLALLAHRDHPADPVLPAGRSLAVVATDAPAAWLLRGTDAGVAVARETDAAADVTLTGPALALLLALMRRTPADEPGVAVTGDVSRWLAWRENTRF